MKQKILNIIYKNPKTTLITFTLLVLASIPGFLYLKLNFSYSVWYNADDPLMLRYKEFEKRFGNDAGLVIGIHNPKGILNNKSLLLVNKITNDLWETPDIIRVDSLANYDFVQSENDEITVLPLAERFEGESFSDNEIKDLSEKIINDKLLKDYLIDENFTTTLLIAQLRPEFDETPDYKFLTKHLKEFIAKYEKKYPDYRFMISGDVAIVDEFRRASFADLYLLVPLLYLLFTLIFIYIYRRKSGVFLPYLVLTTSILMMMGFGGYLDIQVNMMTMVAPTILMTVTIADAIHILTVYFLCLKNGYTSIEAAKFSMNKNFYPTLLTTASTAMGFFSFAMARVVPVAELGILVGFGVFFAWLITYGILGPILLLIKQKPTEEIIQNTDDSDIAIPESSFRLADWIEKYKKSIVFITVIVGVISFYFSSLLQVNLDPVAQFKNSNPIVADYNLIEEKLGAATSMEIMIDSGAKDGIKEPEFLNRVEAFEKWMVSNPNISKTLSLTDFIKKTNKSLNNDDESQYVIPQNRKKVAEEIFFYSLNLPQGRELNNRVSIDNRYLRMTFWWNTKDSQTAQKYFDLIHSKAKELDLTAIITGKTPLFHQLTPHLVTTFVESFLIAIASITLLLIIILRSLSLGLLTLIPNVLPLVIGGGFYYLLGFEVDTVTVIIASVCLGVAVDDSIHFLFEFQRFTNKGWDYRKSIARIITTTYPSLFFTTLVVAIGFFIFVLGSYIPNIKFGIMVAFILIIALIADFIVLPACLYLMEKKKAPDSN